MNNSTNKLVSELRFPEFVNDGEWEEMTISEILVEGKLGGNYENTENTEGIPIIKMGNIERGKINLDKIQYLPLKSPYNIDDILKTGDLLFNTRNTLELVGKVAIWKSELPFALYNSNLMRMTFSEKFVASNFFMNYFFNTELGLKKLKSIATGTTSVAAIYTKDLLTVKVTITNKEEQQKIASCLSSLDEVIAAHSQKLEALKEHKKGLMQNLFPQEGETVPKWRFPEFENDGEWVESTIDQLVKENILFSPKDGNHGNIHPKSSDYVSTGIPFIMASDLRSGKIDFNNCSYLKKEQADSLQKGFSKGGDVLLSHKGTLGEVVLLKDIEFPYLMLTPQVTYYRVKNKNKISNAFLATFFSSDFYQRNLVNVSGGGTRAYVGITEQGKLKIKFPDNIEEQKKIAECISSLDGLITAESEKIAQLTLHKKGLMQGLFPKNND